MGNIEDLEKLQKLQKCGILTDEELEIEKKKILDIENNVENLQADTESSIVDKVCNECGNVIFEADKFCGKCGKKIMTNKQTNKKKRKYLIISAVSVLIFAVLVVIIVNISENDDHVISDNNSTNNYDVKGSNTIEMPMTTETKTYYDFIDTKYYTFDFTENQIINRIMQGYSYTSQGYERIKGVEDNTYCYTKVTIQDVQNLSITSNPTNNKVSKINMLVVGNSYTQEQLSSIAYSGINNIICWLIDYDSTDENDVQQAKQLAEELLDNSCTEKGLKLNYSQDSISVSIEIEVTQ